MESESLSKSLRVPIFDERGIVRYAIAVFQDITKRKLAEEELHRYRDQLEELVEARTVELAEVNQQLQRRVQELTSLNLVGQTVASVTDLQTIFNNVAETMTDLFGAFSTGISVYNMARRERSLVAWHTGTGYAGPDYIGEVFSTENDQVNQRLFESERAFVLSDPQTTPLFTELLRQTMQERQVQCMMFVPLLARAEVIGNMTVSSTEDGRVFSADELNLAETIAGQVAAAIDMARLFEREKEQRQMAESLQETAAVLNSSLDLKVVLRKILEQLKRLVVYDGATIYLREGRHLVVQEADGIHASAVGSQISFAENSPVIEVFQQAKLHGATAETDTLRNGASGLAQSVGSWMGAPLIGAEDVIGVLILDNHKPAAYDDEDLGILERSPTKQRLR